MQTSPVLDLAYRTPIYTQAEAARIIQAPATSFARWAHGHQFKQRDGRRGETPPILTGVLSGRGAAVSFSALTEGFVIESFRRAGLSMARILPAVKVLRDEMGVADALLSEQLMTDGAEILYKKGEGDLVVVRNQQGVFKEAVSEYLKSLKYRDGFVQFIQLPGFESVEVVVDPYRNSGQPTIDRIGVRVEDVLSRIRANESMDDVAEDFGLEPEVVRSLYRQAA